MRQAEAAGIRDHCGVPKRKSKVLFLKLSTQSRRTLPENEIHVIVFLWILEKGIKIGNYRDQNFASKEQTRDSYRILPIKND
jgi:hypothetical protein